jgi:transcriptional regulator with XRE-family HTH domain
VEILLRHRGFLKSGMAKKPPKQFRQLYVGEWIEAAGVPQSAVVKGTNISQGYISNMSGGRRSNPSAEYLLRISEFIGVSMNDFYVPPPARSDVEWLGRYSPQARETLLNKRKSSA